MSKMKERKDDFRLKEHPPKWAMQVKTSKSLMPGSHAYSLRLSVPIKRRFDWRKEYEIELSTFFQTDKGRNTLIFCWRTNGLILIVFPSY